MTTASYASMMDGTRVLVRGRVSTGKRFSAVLLMSNDRQRVGGDCAWDDPVSPTESEIDEANAIIRTQLHNLIGSKVITVYTTAGTSVEAKEQAERFMMDGTLPKTAKDSDL